MADFDFLENIAARIIQNRLNLHTIEDTLSDIKAKIHEVPLKRTTESAFAKMIGIGYEDNMAELEKQRQNLEQQKDNLRNSINNDLNTFISEISSTELVVPLEPNPEKKDGKTIYRYRNNTQFKNIFEILSELLVLSSPLIVKDVMLSSAEIIIAVSDEFEAKQKFIRSMNEIQNTLQIKKR